MPRPPAYIPTPYLNAIATRIYVRDQGGPRHPDLYRLSQQHLTEGFRRSSQRRDKQRLRILERLGEAEKLVIDSGGTIEEELAKPEKGVFGPLLMDLIDLPLAATVPDHDPGVLRFQYNLLRSYEKKYPLPLASTASEQNLKKRAQVKRFNGWLDAYWCELGERLSTCRCLCDYNQTKPTYADLSDNKTTKIARQDFLDRLLAHLHRSTPSSINQSLKPSRHTPHEQRL